MAAIIENKAVPKLRFKEFKEDWEVNKLSKYIRLYRGSSPRPINKYRTKLVGVNWIKIGDTKECHNYIINSVSEKITEEGSLQSRKVNVGELILANSMSFGKTYLLNIHGCIYDGWFVLREFENNFNKYFLHQLLNSEYMMRQYLTLSTGGVVQNISSDIVYSSILCKPTLPEQEKIATFLSAVDDKLQQLTKKKELLQSYKKGIMQKIFSQDLRFKDTNGNNYPQWQEKKLGEVLSIPEKIKPKTIDKEKILTVKLHLKGVQKNSNTSGLSLGATYYIRRSGEFIYGKQNLFNGAFGIVPIELDGYLSSGDIPSLSVDKNKLIPFFLIYYLGRKSYYKRLEAIASGTGSKRIHENILFNIKVKLPSLPEQEKIANFLSSIDSKIELVSTQIENTKVFKKGLLQQMFV